MPKTWGGVCWLVCLGHGGPERERYHTTLNALVRGITVHPTAQARHAGIILTSPLSLTSTPTLKVFENTLLPHQSHCPCPGSISHWLSLGFIKSSSSSKPLYPLSHPFGFHLFLHGHPMVNNFNYPSHHSLQSLTPWLPNKTRQLMPKQEFTGPISTSSNVSWGAGRGSVVWWYGGCKAHARLSIHLDVGMNLRVATYSWENSVWVNRVIVPINQVRRITCDTGPGI